MSLGKDNNKSGEQRNKYILNNMGSFSSDGRSNKFNSTSIAKILILKLLLTKGKYGHEIISEIEQIFENAWRPSPGLIYPLLRDMEADMLICGEWDIPDKKSTRTYRITDDGIKQYQLLLSIYKPIIDDAQNIIERVKTALYK